MKGSAFSVVLAVEASCLLNLRLTLNTHEVFCLKVVLSIREERCGLEDRYSYSSQKSWSLMKQQVFNVALLASLKTGVEPM